MGRQFGTFKRRCAIDCFETGKKVRTLVLKCLTSGCETPGSKRNHGLCITCAERIRAVRPEPSNMLKKVQMVIADVAMGLDIDQGVQ